MHILNPMLCYNSLDIIPYVIKCNQEENIDLFVLDNYSTDGSWEYLQDNKIPSKRVDTNNTFDLNLLLHYKKEVIDKIKPDWIILTGSDDFIYSSVPVINFIKKVSSNGFDVLNIPLIRFFNTGENRINPDPRKIFFYYSIQGYMKVFHTYKNFTEYFGDEPVMDKNYQIAQTENILFLDYGNTREKEKREEEYQRRKLAWERGLPRHFGNHYKDASERGWLWNKNNLNDIRKSVYWKTIYNKC